MERHDDAVAAIARNIKKFYARKEPFRIYHGSTNSTRQYQYQPDGIIDTSGLSNVLKVDVKAKTVLVQPNVHMDRLVEVTLQHGLIPPVVMEFPGITVGGGFAGTAGESSSFRYGFFDRTVNWIEMILGNGEIVRASCTERSDLFFGAASSFGTLGVTTLLEIQLVEASTYVELTYYPIRSMSEAQQTIEKATSDSSIDYLDGIMFSQHSGVICVGHRTYDASPVVKVQRFTRAIDPWFYLHAKRLIRRNAFPVKEAVPIVDYLFRYDRGAFWVGAYAFKYFITPFNCITRWLLDSFMHTRVMYHALHSSGLSSQYIIQDVAIPYTKADEFLQYLDISFQHYPIWLCPLKQSGKSIASTHSLQVEKRKQRIPEMMLNFGVWGPGPKRPHEFVAWNRQFEHKVHALGGQKWLYAHTYYTEEEFNNIYNSEKYNDLRDKYHASYLPTVYDKVSVDINKEMKAIKQSWRSWVFAVFWSIWPLAGLYGLIHTIIRRDYLLPRGFRKKQA